MSKGAAAAIVALTLAVGVGVGALAGTALVGSAGATLPPVAVASDAPSVEPSSEAPSDSPSPAQASPVPSASAEASPSASVEPSPSGSPAVGPSPSPTRVPSALTGRLVTPAVARRHVVAVMVDDQFLARPQSGLSQASIVWQAPAEGGIPRYMALFQDTLPTSVGPIRSSRYYFISWASEWNAVYVHVGGSPQALAFLRSAEGRGKSVWNADGFRYEGRYLYRIKTRFAPHNVYSDAKSLRRLIKAVGAKDKAYKPAWQFAPDAAYSQRPKGGTIVVPYLANRITYRYDRKSNTYLRAVTGEKKQTDLGTKKRIAPKNVVIMVVSFAPLNDGSHKNRLEAKLTGKGTAWIATNGKTVKGTWRKKTFKSPTQFFGPDGKPVTLTVGQTFVQVIPRGYRPTIKDGKVPPPPPATGASGSQGALLQ